MGLIFRRAINVGPLRINIGKSGVGFSVGGPGHRTGVRSTGRRYTRVSAPGTGLGYHITHGTARAGTSGTGCAVLVAAGLGIGLGLAWIPVPLPLIDLIR
jgi:hypothetical protein